MQKRVEADSCLKDLLAYGVVVWMFLLERRKEHPLCVACGSNANIQGGDSGGN
jgi:hypothetical protein